LIDFGALEDTNMTLQEVKPAMTAQTRVIHRGIEYYITGCTMRLRGGEWYYQLELHDLRANSVTIADIKNVELTPP
jgi:hypothetical protein